MTQKLTKTVFYTFTVATLAAFVLFFPHGAFALGFGSQPIGGKITSTRFCTCSFATKIVVEGPAGGTFMKVPFLTRVYDYKNLDSGKWVVGKTTFMVWQCKQFALIGCVDDGSGPVIGKIGTS